jgi:hypothetical protein
MSDRKFVVGNTATVGDFVPAYTLDWAKTANLLNGLSRVSSLATLHRNEKQA